MLSFSPGRFGCIALQVPRKIVAKQLHSRPIVPRPRGSGAHPTISIEFIDPYDGRRDQERCSAVRKIERSGLIQKGSLVTRNLDDICSTAVFRVQLRVGDSLQYVAG